MVKAEGLDVDTFANTEARAFSNPQATPSVCVGTHLKVDELTMYIVQIELEQRYQAPVKLGGLERRIARRLSAQQPLLEQGGIGYVRPEKGWHLG